MTSHGRRARPLWHDRALESPRAGWVITGIGCSFALLGVIMLAVDLAARAPWWAYALLALWPLLAGWMIRMGAQERARAREHSDTMRSYGEAITGAFEALLRERDGHQ